jgi:adenine-specific DNA methylase
LKLIEKEFPLQEVNIFAGYDMTFKYMKREFRESIERLLNASELKFRGLPKIHNLMYYPARRPPSAARAVTLASALEYSPDISKEVFLKAVGLENARKLARESGALVTLYMADPDRELVKKLLGRDPKEITVVDPMAGGGSIPLEALRLGFRTIAGDYNPLAYLILRATIEFPAKYGKRLLELLEREARDLVRYAEEALGKFYDKNVKRYLFFISAEHECGGIIPLARHTLLSRSKGLYVKPVFDKENKKLMFQVSQESPAFSPAICPYCGRSVSESDIREKWVEEHLKLLEDLLEGKIERAKDAPKVYVLAAVQLAKGRYRAPDERDVQLLVEASEELARSALREREEGKSIEDYLPLAEIPEDNKVFKKLRSYGLKYWYQLYTPRQLLALYKLVKYVRARAEALSKQYGELGVVTALYLALSVAKEFNYDNILTQWDPGSESIRDLAGSQYALGKRVDLGYDYCEGNIPYLTLPWALEAEEEETEESEESEEVETTRGGLLPLVRLLCNRLEGLWKEGLDAIYLWDARKLHDYLPEKSVDIIEVDPPYYEQHDYAGITEFFWAIVQQALWSVLGELFPRDRVRITNWAPEDPKVPRGIEIRGEPPKKGSRDFEKGFKEFLEAASRVLKDDGLLVVWYAYGKLEGWDELFRMLYDKGYGVTKTWQVWSEMGQRRIALEKTAFFTSMVIVARPRVKRTVMMSLEDPTLSKIFSEDVRRTVESSIDYLLETYGLNALKEALTVSLADGFAKATFYSLVVGLGSYVGLSDKALKISIFSVLDYLAKNVARVGLLELERLDPITKLYTFLLLASSEDLRVSYDFANRIAQILQAPFLNSLRASQEKGSIRLLSPIEFLKVFEKYEYNMGKRAIKLVINIKEVFARHGLRAAEDVVMKAERDEVSLAKLLVATAWSKLGLSDDEKDTLLKVLAVGGSP